MPLFELSSALSCELGAANQLATRLSNLECIQDLAEATTAAEALAKITAGIADDPLDSDEHTLGELENQHFFAQIYADPEEGHVAGLSPAAMDTPKEGGLFRVYLRRQVRGSEERSDAYNFFWDRVSAIGAGLILAAETTLTSPRNYRFKQVGRAIGPEFGRRRSEGDRGAFLFALLTVTWGDIEAE
jgi:hypothetical protein